MTRQTRHLGIQNTYTLSQHWRAGKEKAPLCGAFYILDVGFLAGAAQLSPPMKVAAFQKEEPTSAAEAPAGGLDRSSGGAPDLNLEGAAGVGYRTGV